MAHITDIIKYEGDNSTFIWKHPKEDFNTMTQLIVHESQLIPQGSTKTVVQNTGTDVDALIQRMNLLLAEKQWQNADMFAENILLVQSDNCI